MNKTAEILCGTFASGVAITILPEIQKTVQPDTLAILLAAFSGAVIFSLIRILYLLPMRLLQIRRLVDRKFGVEGYWFELVNDGKSEHPYSFAWIRYDFKRKKFSYKGVNFREDLTVYADWHSDAVVIDDDESLSFLFEAHLSKNAEDIKGHGFLNFNPPTKGKYMSGYGSFVDSGTDTMRSRLSIKRIPGEYAKKIIGTSDVVQEEDVRKLLKQVIAEPVTI